MYKVRNRKAVRRLAMRQIRAGRRMNAVVVLSIMLTCILFTALFSIGGGITKSFQAETMRQVGGSAMAGVKYILPEDYEKISADPAVKHPSYRIIVGNAVNESLKNVSVEVNFAQDENAKALFSYPTEGRMPEKRNEIAMSTLALDDLGIAHEIGEKVPLKIDIDGTVIEEEFVLCGFWQGDPVAMAQESFVSREFCDEVAPVPEKPFHEDQEYRYGGYWMMDFDFSNSWNIEKKMTELVERCGYEDIDYGVNWAYIADSVDPGTMAMIGALLAVILLAGYLMIYNVFYINVTANIRNYGLLKTIGMTGRQLKSMVRQQAFLYAAVGILPGFVIGTLISRLLLPVVMESLFGLRIAELSLHVFIYAAAMLFTFATVWLSCLKPCKYAASVTPVEALRHSGASGRRRRKRTARVTAFSMARANLSRTKKKTVIVVLSLSLSVVLLNLVYTAVNGFDADKFIRDQIMGDFMIGDSSVMKTNSSLDRRTDSVTAEDLSYLSSIGGVKSVADIYFSDAAVRLDKKHSGRVSQFMEQHADLIGEEEDWSIESVKKEKEILTDLYGINRPAFDLLAKEAGDLDPEKFFSGSYAIVYTYNVHYRLETDGAGEDAFYRPGEKVKVELPDGSVKKYEVLAVMEMPYAVSLKAFSLIGAQVMIPDSEYLAHCKEKGAMYAVLNVQKEKTDQIDAALKRYVEHGNTRLIYTSRQSYLDEFRKLIDIFWILGGALSLILALIGILNFINASVTGIFARKREFAAMQAVGMTGRQLTGMLAWEGIFYALFTVCFSLAAAGLIGKFVVKTFFGEMFFFTYHFTLAPVLFCAPVLLIFSMLVPFFSYRAICSGSVVDRMREAEG